MYVLARHRSRYHYPRPALLGPQPIRLRLVSTLDSNRPSSGLFSGSGLSVGLLRIGENPALVVLGFDDEYAEPRNADMVNLSCPVFHLRGHAVHQVIVGGPSFFSTAREQQRLAAIL